jgi:5'-nucleotidase
VAKYEEVYEKRTDPIGRDYYWASGKLQNNDHGKDTDESALAEGYISIVPCQFDMTAHHAIAILNSEWNIN